MSIARLVLQGMGYLKGNFVEKVSVNVSILNELIPMQMRFIDMASYQTLHSLLF